MTRIALIAALAGSIFAVPALAQEPFDQNAAQAACGGDVMGLCQQAMPDHNRIAACLRQNFRQVSQPCQQFMANYGKSASKSAHNRRGPQRETTGAAISR
jgi:hypothetical protein